MVSTPICRKLTLVGGAQSGKTCLVYVLSRNIFPEYFPAVFESFSVEVTVDGVPMDIYLWDTKGSEDYDRLRPLSYPETNVVLLCYAIDSPDSLEIISEQFVPEVSHFLPDTPKVLLGCKSDLRDDPAEYNPDKSYVSTKQGDTMAKSIGASAFFECSAKTRHGIDVFLNYISALLMASPSKKLKRRRCLIL